MERIKEADDTSYAVIEDLAKLESNLRSNQETLQYLYDRGLSEFTIRKFHLGIKDPYQRKVDGQWVTNLLRYPLLSTGGEPLDHYGHYKIPGVTENFDGEILSSPTRARTYHTGDIVGMVKLFVAGSCEDIWILDQHLTSFNSELNILLISSTHSHEVPDEWMIPSFWASWESVYLGFSGGKISEQLINQISRCCGRDIMRVRVPEGMGSNWSDFFLAGGTTEQFEALLQRAEIISCPPSMLPVDLDQPGEFAANPVNINGAFINGNLYYPFTVERRELNGRHLKDGDITDRLVTSYVTKIVRSDGAVLDIVRLPAPRGTPHSRRVLALTDGTRIDKEPQPTNYSTWQLENIQLFITRVRAGDSPPHRPLCDLLKFVEEHLKASVWLPIKEDYSILSLYVAMSYVYQVFPAIPLILIVGEKASGKTALGEAIASVSFNSFIIGQGSAASIIRLLNDTRGLAVIDDVESLSMMMERSFSDMNQMLKLSYKKQTGRKTITHANGKTTTYEFYGPKVITNTQGVDQILGSRMLQIRTQAMPAGVMYERLMTMGQAVDVIALRNEFHAWGMANACKVNAAYEALLRERLDRIEEIAAPLRAIALLSESHEFSKTLERALCRQAQAHVGKMNQNEILIKAASNCVLKGARSRLSAAQLTLEISLLLSSSLEQNYDGKKLWMRSEWIGQQLKILGIREPNTAVSRSRLYGKLTRIYHLNRDYVAKILSSRNSEEVDPINETGQSFTHAFDFCVKRESCLACCYQEVCPATISGLRQTKERKLFKPTASSH